MKTKTYFVVFFKCLHNFGAHALQLELNKSNISNFNKFQLQSMSSIIERAFEKNFKKFHQNQAKKATKKDHKSMYNFLDDKKHTFL